MANYHYVHNLWQSVRGDSKHFYVLVISWKLKHFGANCKQGINSLYNSIKFCINTKININFNFHHVPKLSIGFNRPYALTSRLHNNDAMLGIKICRAARTCCAGRAHWRSASQSVRGPGQARRYGMQGLALWLHSWRLRTWQCLVWPPTRGGALMWRHMHMVYAVKRVLETSPAEVCG